MYNYTRAQIENVGHQGVGASKPLEDYTLVRCLDSFWMHMPNEDESLTPAILEHGFWESWVTSWVTRWLRPGMTFLDVGANCGYYTMVADRLVGRYGSVVAYEANPAYEPYLEGTRKANGSNFELVSAAVTNESDAMNGVELSIPANLFGSASIVDDFPSFDTKTVIVPSTTLDRQKKSGKIPDGPRIIKIDVEGAEQAVWDGAQTLLNDEFHTTLLMEWTPGAYTRDFLPQLQAWGTVRIVNVDGGEEEPYHGGSMESYLASLTDWCTLSVRRR